MALIVDSATWRLNHCTMIYVVIKILLDLLEIEELGVLQLVIKTDCLLFVGRMQQFGRFLEPLLLLTQTSGGSHGLSVANDALEGPCVGGLRLRQR